MAPLALVMCLLATQEMLGLYRKQGHQPIGWAMYLGTLLPLAGACAPIIWQKDGGEETLGQPGWLAWGLAAGMIVVILGEMFRFREPGAAIVNLALAALAILYVGGLMGFLVQLRLLRIGDDVSLGGLCAFLSAIVVVKLADIGAFAAGHCWGRRKLAPVLSPGKTWEGVFGGLALALVGALLTLGPLAQVLGCGSQASWQSWLVGSVSYGLVVSSSGILGDLAESLLKRDAGVKDSSDWLPGFGGVLDMLDSLLVAAPVAYLFWVMGVVGP